MKKNLIKIIFFIIVFCLPAFKTYANDIIYSNSSNFNNWTTSPNSNIDVMHPGAVLFSSLPYTTTNQWLFSHSIHLEAGRKYSISFNITPLNMIHSGYLYLYIGSLPDTSSMNTYLGASQYNIHYDNHFSVGCAIFSVNSSGYYHFGWHDSRSNFLSNTFSFTLNNVTITEINNPGINLNYPSQGITFGVNNWTYMGYGSISNGGYGEVMFGNSGTGTNNQWLFSPAFKLYCGITYKVKFKYTEHGNWGSVFFAIGDAPFPCGMHQYRWVSNGIIIGKKSKSTTDDYSEDVIINYTPTSSGAFYFGWADYQHAFIQPSSGCSFSISNFSIELRGCLWTGGTSNNWDDPNNWYQSNKPQSNNDAIITSDAPYMPVVTTYDTIKNLVITSGASIIGEEKLTITGTTTCYRDIDAGKWHLASSPIPGATASIFKPATGNGYLRAYNNGVGWGGYFGSPYSQLAMGVGYAVYLENKTTATVSGNLNSGNITRSLTKGSNGWNLLGNPFASGLDFGQLNLLNAHLETNSVYFWNQSYAESNSGSYMVYNVTSEVGTSGATSVISPFQGFFVKTTYNGNLELSNTARTHTLNTFYKSNPNTQLVTRLKISNDQGFKDEMLVCINDSSNNTYEAYDSEKLLAETNTPEIFAYASGGEKLTIDAINSYPAIIPLSVISPLSGILTLTAFDFSSFDPSVNILLYDNQTSTIIDLRAQPSYTFSSDTGENNNRFFLHIGNTTGMNETVNNSFASICCKDKSINITPFGGEKIINIEIIDPTGKLLNSVNVNGNEKTTIPANYTTGIYLIRIYGNHKMMTQKIFVY